MKPVIVFTVEDIVSLAIIGLIVFVAAVLLLGSVAVTLYDKMVKRRQRRLEKRRAKKEARDGQERL